MTSKCKHLLRGIDGAEIAEAAVVLPIVFLLLFGVLWFGRAFNVYATVHRAAREAAQAGAVATCATCSAPETFPSPATVQANVVNPILQAAHMDVDVAHLKSFTLLTGVPLNPGSTPIETGTVATLTYLYPFKLNGITCCPMAFTTITNGITITAQAQAREEQ